MVKVMNVKYFGKIPFKLYKIATSKKAADSIAEVIRKQGYYVRLKGSSKGIEIWVSLNPKWFYKFGQW